MSRTVRRLAALFFVVAAPTFAQTSPGATVEGVVRDSIAHRSLAGARVQIVSAAGTPSFSMTEGADSLGRYALRNVPDGRFMIGFFHPVLDSLGVEAPLREVRIESHRSARVDLATPSGQQIRTAVCGAQAQRPEGATDSGAVIIGVIRSATDQTPVNAAKVSADWLEMRFGKEGITRRVPRITAVTGDNGWFALCNVPSGGNVMLSVVHDADSTDLVEVRVPGEGFLRRELFIGAARTVVQGDTTAKGDTTSRALRRIHLGDVRLTGTVVSAEGGRPVSGAQVGIANGPQVHTNERGEWIILDAPAGTRTLEIRAVTYYPDRRAIDVVAGAPPVRVTLSTMKAVLDTVRVTATSLYNRDRNGFLLRRRSGNGRYLNAQEIERRAGAFTTDALRMMQGVRVSHTTEGKKISVNGAFGWCEPEIWVDGLYVPGADADDIDSWASPGHVTGIEIYVRPPVPAEFQHGFSGCGSIVVWTR